MGRRREGGDEGAEGGWGCPDLVGLLGENGVVEELGEEGAGPRLLGRLPERRRRSRLPFQHLGTGGRKGGCEAVGLSVLSVNRDELRVLVRGPTLLCSETSVFSRFRNPIGGKDGQILLLCFGVLGVTLGPPVVPPPWCHTHP